MKLVLGSSSKYRKAMMEREGYIFDVIDPAVDEKAIQTSDPYERPMILARAKTEAVIAKIKEPAIIVASDQVIVCDGVLYEKPSDEAEVRKMLAHYNDGGVPESVVAVVVTNTETGEWLEVVDKAKIFFKKIPEDAIQRFIDKNEPLTRAGGFGIKNTELSPYVDHIEGTEDSVTGLPVHLLKDLLIMAGYQKQ